MNKDRFIIVTGNKYPEEDAGAVRQHSFAKMLKAIGLEPIVIGIGQSTNFKQEIYDGIKYYSLRYAKNNKILRAWGRIRFCDNAMRILTKIDPNSIKGILIVSGDKKTFTKIKQYANQHTIQLYHDSVEWYSPSEFKKGERDRSYQLNNLINSKIIDKSFKVISISTYLEKYYSSKNICTIRIPVVLDVENIKPIKNNLKEEIKLVYAGSIGGKDHICEMITAIDHLQKVLDGKFKFYVIGISQKDYIEKYGTFKNNLVVFLGRLSRREVMEHYENATYSFLLRPENERYAMAGFPTKVVESLSAATPVICNITSDLDQYLIDDENAVIVKECSVEACEKTLMRIIETPKDKKILMQEMARKTALAYFDWRRYVRILAEFINQ